MAKRLMIDPPGGWRYGFPKYVPAAEGQKVFDLSLEGLEKWLSERGYPDHELRNAGWTRFMWLDETDEY